MTFVVYDWLRNNFKLVLYFSLTDLKWLFPIGLNTVFFRKLSMYKLRQLTHALNEARRTLGKVCVNKEFTALYISNRFPCKTSSCISLCN